jgi:phosphoesterase RecJ-like protein
MEQAIAYLKEKDNFIILTHRRPDGDTLGSGGALCAGLRMLGKTAWLWHNPDIGDRYLPYIEPFFVPDGYSGDSVVTVDTATTAMITKGWEGPVDLRIDHHPLPPGYARIEYSEPEAAACGEVILKILKTLGVAINKEIAALLYIALITDTGCFRYANTTAHTHLVASELTETGIDAYRIRSEMFTRSRQRLAAEAIVTAGMEFFADEKVVLTSLTLDNRGGAVGDDLENISGVPFSIRGIKVSILLREEPGCWRFSCRTANPYLANKICGILGGGGHDNAAGAEIKGVMTAQEARARALEVLWEAYPDLKS